VTNKAGISCRLSTYPGRVALASASGTLVRGVSLPDPQGKLASADFTDGRLSAIPVYSATAATVSGRGAGLAVAARPADSLLWRTIGRTAPR
jgi:hypothetical protein